MKPINMQAVQDPQHPEHHFSLGQLFASLLVGLAAVQQARTQGAGVFLDPTVTGAYLAGIMSIIHPTAQSNG